MTRPDETIELRDYVRVLRAHWVSIVVATLLGLSVAVLFTVVSTREYRAEAKVLVLPLSNPLTSSPSTIQALAPEMNTEREVVRSSAVASLASRSLGATTSTETLQDALSVDVVPNADVLAIQYSDPDPNRAAQVANAFAEGYLSYRKSILTGQLQQAVDEQQASVERTTAQLVHVQTELARVRGSTAIHRMQLKMEQLQYSTALSTQESKLSDLRSTIDSTTGGQVVEPATPPTRPTSPHVRIDLILGLVVGLILGVAIAFVRGAFVDDVRDASEVEDVLGVPVLGSVQASPHEDASVVTRDDPRGTAAEAYRAMGARLRHLFSDEESRVILMTGTAAGSGTSTTVANLGVALAQAGQRVLLLSADFRSPRLHSFFGLPNEPGLSDALTASVDLRTLMQGTEIDNLSLIGAGRVPSNPSVLGGSKMRTVVRSLRRQRKHIVLIDAPPALSGSDASWLGALADGTVLICDARRIDARDLERSKRQLEASGAKVSAAVYNFDRAGAGLLSAFAPNGHLVRA